MMNSLLTFLAGGARDGARLAAYEWEFRPVFPAWALAVALVIGIVLIIAILRRDSAGKGSVVRFSLTGLRAAALALVVMVLAGPTLIASYEKEQRPITAVLVDASRSMAFMDTSGAAPARRWDRTTAAIGSGLLDILSNDADTRMFKFDSRAEVVSASGPGSLSSLAPDGQSTQIGQALNDVRAMMRGLPLRQIVLISDGQDTSGPNPIDAAVNLASSGVRIDALAAGDESVRNIRVEPLLAEPYAFQKDIIQFEVRVAASGYANTSFPVILRVNGQEVSRAEVAIGSEAEEVTARLEYTPETAGKIECLFEVPLQQAETLTDDNVQRHDLEVLDKRMRVLYIEEEPRWEYRFLQTALVRDSRTHPNIFLSVADFGGLPPAGEFLRTLPNTREALFEYDLIIIGDIPRAALTNEQMAWLRDFVIEDGGSVVFMAGRKNRLPFEGTPLEGLVPVVMDRLRGAKYGLDAVFTEPFTMKVSPLGTRHALLSAFRSESAGADPLADLPGMYWHAPVKETRAGALALAEHPWDQGDAGPDPLLVFQYVGRGRTLYIGFEEAWRWRFRYGNRFYYRFWGSVIQYMSMPHLLGKKDLVQFETPGASPVGAAVDAGVRVLSESGAPVEEESQRLAVEHESGLSETITAFPVPEQRGFYRGEFTPKAPGRYRLFLRDYPDRGETVVHAQDSPVELRDPNANYTLLRRIAAAGNGEFAPCEGWQAALDKAKVEPVVTRWIEERTLWDKPWVLLMVTALLSAEWVLRKIWRLL